MIFLTALSSVLPVVLIIALGFYLKSKAWFADSFAGNLSSLIMNIALPASVFVSVLTYLTRDKLLSLSEGLVYGALSFTLCYVLSFILIKVLAVPNGRKGVFVNTIVNANTIFIGLPLNVAMFGENSMPYFLVYYVLNTVSTWTIGAFLIAKDSSQPQANPQGSHHFDAKKLLPPPLIGFLVALVFLLADIPVPAFAHSTLSYIGALVTPLSLLYIGISLYDAGLKSIRFDKDTIAALIGKFLLAPVVMAGLIYLGRTIQPLPSVESQTLIMQSAVSALAVLPILADKAGGDVRFANNIVTTSTVLFMLVVPIVDVLLTMSFG